MASDDSTNTTDLTPAWQGQGYSLVGLCKWDEAEALYKKCIALDPQGSRAKGSSTTAKRTDQSEAAEGSMSGLEVPGVDTVPYELKTA
ncbi:MAG: tetratricopeptide repeat protein [Proteobacteria bacterium]|nr:tetratricopeptide repeat protein [Pseudomonadota bacterium]